MFQTYLNVFRIDKKSNKANAIFVKSVRKSLKNLVFMKNRKTNFLCTDFKKKNFIDENR